MGTFQEPVLVYSASKNARVHLGINGVRASLRAPFPAHPTSWLRLIRVTLGLHHAEGKQAAFNDATPIGAGLESQLAFFLGQS
jgi:hypothetical protein